jgi:uracil-DNA glycosylase family 4
MDLDQLNAAITSCRRCPRLVEWREAVGRVKRASYADQTYWAKPVPVFGDPAADRLIVGLAPGAHGANRTGLMFHGDRSGVFLYRALHRAGVASTPNCDSKEDGQVLRGVMITASAHCAPPDNKPTPDELVNCAPFLREVLLSREWKSILCLGGIAWSRTLAELHGPKVGFTHGGEVAVGPTQIIASYHVSQQNTFTGRLTEAMFDEIIARWLA